MHHCSYPVVIYHSMTLRTFIVLSTSLLLACSERANESTEIYFGLYCGECDRNCSVIIKLDNNEAYADTSRTFFDWHFNQGNIPAYIFPTQHALRISDTTYSRIEHLLNVLPANLDSTKTEIGCPDCRDQCGIYFANTNGFWDIDPDYRRDLSTFIDSATAYSVLVHKEVFRKSR